MLLVLCVLGVQAFNSLAVSLCHSMFFIQPPLVF